MSLPKGLLDHLAEKLGEQDLQVTRELGGEHHVNYVLRGDKRYVLRSFDSDEAQRAEKEYNLLARLDGTGAPRVYLKDVSGMRWDRPFFVEEFMDGAAVGEMSPRVIRDAARALRHLHDATESAEANPPFISDWTIQRLLISKTSFSDRLKDAFADTAEAIAPEMVPAINSREQFCWIHGDPTMPNMLLLDRGLVLVDWEFCRTGHRYEDLAAFIMENRLSSGAADLFLEAYGRGVDRSRLDAFCVRRLLEATAWAAERFEDRGDSDSRALLEDCLARLESSLSRDDVLSGLGSDAAVGP